MGLKEGVSSKILGDGIEGLEGPRVLDGPQRGKMQQKCPEKARDHTETNSDQIEVIRVHNPGS